MAASSEAWGWLYRFSHSATKHETQVIEKKSTSTDIDVNALEAAIPHVLEWIETTLKTHEADAVPVSTLGCYIKLRQHYPLSLLDNTNVVKVKALPLPPLRQLGFPSMPDNLHGITYKDTFFVLEPNLPDSLCFHEMVHIVQWKHLGPERFIRAYGVGLSQFDYRSIPLEKMAYAFEQDFKHNALPQDLITAIQQQTDKIWNEVAPFLKEITKGR